MKNRVLALLLCGAMVASLAGCTVTGRDEPSGSAPVATPTQTEPAAPSSTTGTEPSTAPVVAPVTLDAAGTLGDYAAEIKDFVLTKDYSGKPAIVITYSFTNNSEDATSAMVALIGSAYQNGVQLGSTIIADDKIYNFSNSMLDIKAGGSLDIQAAYSLTSETAPVEFELSELISFSEDALGKTYEIAAGGVTEPATIDVPADAATGKVGDFEVSIISMTTGKDYEDKDCVTIVYGFKNNGAAAESFATACMGKAYQDSVQLATAIVTGTTVSDAVQSLTKVKPGAAILVTQSYLTTSASDVEVEVAELFSFSDEKVARTFAMG